MLELTLRDHATYPLNFLIYLYVFIHTMNPEPDGPGVPGGGQVLGRALVPPLVALDRDGDDQAASGVDEHSAT